MLRINTAADASYYSGSVNERESAGVWDGALSRSMGLSGADMKALKAMLDRNRTPEGKRLTPLDNANRRGGYDLTFSEPKSVSIMEQVMGDDRIGQARRESVAEIMATLVEPMATTRRWNVVRNDTITTGNLAYIAFDHLLARPDKGMPDPNGHTHVVLANATEWKGKRTALEIRPIKEAAPFIEAAWHALFAEKLKGLGYGIRQTRTAFEIEGVADSDIRLYSKRTVTVENELERREKSLSEQIKGARNADELRLLEGRIAKLKSPKGKSALGALTRELKIPELSQAAIDADWMKRLTATAFQRLARVRQKATEAPPSSPEMRDAFHLQNALHSLLRTESRVSEERLYTQALKSGVGEVSLPGLQGALAGLPDVIHANAMVATAASLEAEADVVDFARRGRLVWEKHKTVGVPDAAKLTFPALHAMVREADAAGEKLRIAGDAKGLPPGHPLKILREFTTLKPEGEKDARAKKPPALSMPTPKLVKGWARAMKRHLTLMRKKVLWRHPAAEGAQRELGARTAAGRQLER